MRTRLEQSIREVATEHEWTVSELAIQRDQVHLVVRADPNTLPWDIPRRIKGRSAHLLREEFPQFGNSRPCGRARSSSPKWAM